MKQQRRHPIVAGNNIEAMTNRLPDFEPWAIFATVAARGSFAAVAELGLANPTVSKAVARLEARLGTAYLGAALPAFLDAYPGITLDIALSDRRVDLVADGFDLALRIADLESSALRTRRLCAIRILLVAAPAYLEGHGRPTHPAQLKSHHALIYTGSPAPGLWRFQHPEFGEETVEPTPRLWADNADMLNPALLAAQGLALQPEFLVWRELRQGRLEIAMPAWTAKPLALHLLMPPNPLRPQRVQLLIDHLAQTLARPPWAD